MTIHDPLEPLHRVTHAYIGRCSCGWLGLTHDAEENATAEVEAHQRECDTGIHEWGAPVDSDCICSYRGQDRRYRHRAGCPLQGKEPV